MPMPIVDVILSLLPGSSLDEAIHWLSAAGVTPNLVDALPKGCSRKTMVTHLVEAIETEEQLEALRAYLGQIRPHRKYEIGRLRRTSMEIHRVVIPVPSGRLAFGEVVWEACCPPEDLCNEAPSEDDGLAAYMAKLWAREGAAYLSVGQCRNLALYRAPGDDQYLVGSHIPHDPQFDEGAPVPCRFGEPLLKNDTYFPEVYLADALRVGGDIGDRVIHVRPGLYEVLLYENRKSSDLDDRSGEIHVRLRRLHETDASPAGQHG